MLNSKSNNDYEKLRNAIRKKDKVTAQKLIQNNASVNISNTKSISPLHWAIIKFDDLDIMKMLLDRGANIHAKNHRNKKPFQVAIENNKTDAALLLMEKGAIVGENLYTLLYIAIEQSNTIIVKSLIDHGVQSNPLIDWKIPLNVAILRGRPTIIEYILPHCKFVQPPDLYIPKEAVIKSGAEYKECVKLLLKWNFTIDPTSHKDKEFVYGAVENGHLPIVLQLLKMGIDVNLINPKTGLNLLKVACFNSYHEIVENLLKHKACVNVTTSTNTKILNDNQWNSDYIDQYHAFHSFMYCKINLCNITCLQIAVLNSDLQMTQLLLKYGATIINDPKFFYVTGIAVYNNCEEIVRTLLDHGVDVNDIDFEGKTLLHYCVLTSADGQDYRYSIVKLLLEKGANRLIQTPGNSLLFDAIKNGHSKTAQLFLDYNADIQYISPDGTTLLHKAIEKDFHAEFIRTLLKLNLPVNAVNNKMLTPLLVACKVKSLHQLEIIKALLDFDANVNCPDDNMLTPLHLACQNQYLEVVAALLRKGANPDTKDNKGQTPLHIVCKYKSDITLIMIQLLLQYNANIEAVDVKGWTPLFVACETNNDVAVKCLLNNHANANHTDLKNLTPLYIAAKICKDNFEIIKILLEHKVNVHCMDKRGNSVIHLIAATNSAELIKCFARTKINFNPVNKQGNTPLHIAVKKKSVQMIENLIKYGANVNILDKRKQTPFRNAREYISDDQYTLINTCNDFSQCGRNFYRYANNNGWSVSDYRNHIYQCTEIINILRTQVIKLKVAGLKVNNQNLNFIDYENAKAEILQLKCECKKEIEELKMKSTGVHNMTFYDLLTKNIHILSRYVKNRRIRQTLEREVYDEKYPLYIDIVRSRFRDAKFRYRMLNSAKKYFTSTITQRLSDDCIDTVFSYLNIKELKMFVRAIKSLNK